MTKEQGLPDRKGVSVELLATVDLGPEVTVQPKLQ